MLTLRPRRPTTTTSAPGTRSDSPDSREAPPVVTPSRAPNETPLAATAATLVAAEASEPGDIAEGGAVSSQPANPSAASATAPTSGSSDSRSRRSRPSRRTTAHPRQATTPTTRRRPSRTPASTSRPPKRRRTHPTDTSTPAPNQTWEGIAAEGNSNYEPVVVLSPPPWAVAAPPTTPFDPLAQQFCTPAPVADTTSVFSNNDTRFDAIFQQPTSLTATVVTLLAQSASRPVSSASGSPFRLATPAPAGPTQHMSTNYHGCNGSTCGNAIAMPLPSRIPFASEGRESNWHSFIPTDPPREIATLTTQDSPYPTNRIKGNFYPPPEDTLMSYRHFPARLPRDGTNYSSHSFALFLFARLRDRLQVSSAFIIALSGGRLGSRGASVRWFMEKQRNVSLTTASYNTVISLNFSAGVELSAAACPKCTSMVDFVQAVAGLCNFADAFWYEHARHLTSALQRFVDARMTTDRDPPRPILRLTLNYVDLWLGKALDALPSESVNWWANYRAAVYAISVDSPQWIADLVRRQIVTEMSKTNCAPGRHRPQLPRWCREMQPSQDA
ncbi:hypothetical protein ON010_g16124 [Phytophthora cinnamomi]|nr:hypothetical protein ON010_g16124 [Phytophthora cinnamomi]